MRNTYLLQTLELAAKRQGFTAPNPAVGAIVTKHGKIIGQGFHNGPGQPHAEVVALQNCHESPQGATLFVSLEPCCHYGRTPPCVKAIIEARIKEVFFCYLDPNPEVAGKGQKQLQQAGITCEYIPLHEADKFYNAYRHWMLTGRPWVTAKLALSQDGKIAGENGNPIKITGPELQQFTHEKRLQSDAILSTVETVLCDDPALNVRLNNEPIAKDIYLLDSRLRFPTTAKLNQTAKSITLFHDEKYHKCFPNHIKQQPVSKGLNLQQVIEKIGADGVQALWVEAGAKCFHAMVDQKIADEIFLYVGNKTLGAGTKATDANLDPSNFSKDYILKSSTNHGHDVSLKYTKVVT